MSEFSKGFTVKKALIGVVLGSSSDLPKIKSLMDTLNELEIEFEVALISAHRTPDLVRDYARTAKERGVKVIVACAGLSAALPGALAAETLLPVIGLPLDVGPLRGVDAILSMAQMPSGVPVGTMGIDSAKNAALLAARILAVDDVELWAKLTSLRERMARDVAEKAKSLKKEGFSVWEATELG